MAAEIIEQDGEIQADDLPVEEGVMTPEEVAHALDNPVSTTHQEDLTPVGNTEDDLPEKYRGKSIKEVVSMHQEAERLIGSQGSEVGELRKVVDTYITSQIQQNNSQQPVEPEVDFFEDPQQAVSNAIDSHPAVKEAQQTTAELKQQAALGRLKEKHSDMDSVLSNPKFIDWVKASPMRLEMFQRADQQYDFNAADELIGGFKERNQIAQQTQQVEVDARQQQLRAAQTGSGSGASAGKSKRIYRRADIIKLMKNDPDRYDALSNEIMQAYQEGRVR